jgi:hypothetical protein
MKQFTLRVFCPSVYTVAANTRQEARKKAISKWRQENNKTWIEPEIEVISEADLSPEYWDSVDAAIDDLKERLR